MVKKLIRYVIATAALALAAGCADPYRFTIATPDPVDCRIFTSLHSAGPIPHGLTMSPDAVVGITSLQFTQYQWRAFISAHGGDGWRLMLRPTVEESVRDSGLVLTFFATGGTRLDSSGKMLEANPNFRFPQDSAVVVTIYNEEDYLQVTVGCDTVLRRSTLRRASDDLGLQTLHGTDLKLVAPLWHALEFPTGDHVRAGRGL